MTEQPSNTSFEGDLGSRNSALGLTVSTAYEVIAGILLATTVGSASAAIWLSRRQVLVGVIQPTAPKTRLSVWLHVVGFILFMNGLMLLHFFPTGAFILGIIALMVCVAISRVPCPKDLRLRAQIVASLVGIAWLAHGAYELHLNGWKQTVVGAPIRVDFFILGPLLYFASGKAYATVKRVTKAARASS